MMHIPLLSLLVGLILICLACWVARQLPLPDPIGRIVYVVIVVIGVLWLIGVLTGHPIALS